MKKTLTLAATVLLGGLTLGIGAASAAPMAVDGLRADQSGITQVRMMQGDRMMMMKKRMMRKEMMKRRMMRKRMMNRGM